MSRLTVILTLLVIFSCSKTEMQEPVEYKGPLRVAEKVEMFSTEKDQIKVKMLADVLHEFQNGDIEFPEGIYMEFYDEEGKLESTLKANEAFYFKEKDEWRGRGNVELINIKKKEQLNTEELFWKQVSKKIYTDKFVTIRQESDILYGQGLDANEDLSDYTILKPEGIITVEEEEEL